MTQYLFVELLFLFSLFFIFFLWGWKTLTRNSLLVIFHYGWYHGLQFETYFKLIMKSNCWLLQVDGMDILKLHKDPSFAHSSHELCDALCGNRHHSFRIDFGNSAIFWRYGWRWFTLQQMVFNVQSYFTLLHRKKYVAQFVSRGIWWMLSSQYRSNTRSISMSRNKIKYINTHTKQSQNDTTNPNGKSFTNTTHTDAFSFLITV